MCLQVRCSLTKLFLSWLYFMERSRSSCKWVKHWNGLCTVRVLSPWHCLAQQLQMPLLGTGNSSLGPSSLSWIFLTGQQILTWGLVSDLVSTHLAEGAGESLGQRGIFFFLFPHFAAVKAPNLAGSVWTFSADSLRYRAWRKRGSGFSTCREPSMLFSS